MAGVSPPKGQAFHRLTHPTNDRLAARAVCHASTAAGVASAIHDNAPSRVEGARRMRRALRCGGVFTSALTLLRPGLFDQLQEKISSR
jgi:hypothetical protein